MPVEHLTKRQADALAFIARFCDENGFAPTVREVGAAIGHASPSSTHATLSELRERGLITWNEKTFRTLRICR